MISEAPTLQTQLIVEVFAIFYLVHLWQRMKQTRIDLYDFVMLSSVAILPVAVLAIPRVPELLARLMGVTLPFTVLFGALTFVLFVATHRLTSRLHKLEDSNRRLVQDLALMRMEKHSKPGTAE
jgi:hypothetical protein